MTNTKVRVLFCETQTATLKWMLHLDPREKLAIETPLKYTGCEFTAYVGIVGQERRNT
jgi:hypothetical protein